MPCTHAARSNEWMAGEINHAIYLNTMCEAEGAVFPSRNQNQALTCDRANWPWPMANETGARPKHGSLYFFDYTDEQIEAMDLPAWHKPMIVAMSHYGGYVGDTGGSQIDGWVRMLPRHHAATPPCSISRQFSACHQSPACQHARRTFSSCTDQRKHSKQPRACMCVRVYVCMVSCIAGPSPLAWKAVKLMTRRG